MFDNLALEAEGLQASANCSEWAEEFEAPFEALDSKTTTKKEPLVDQMEDVVWAFGCLDPHERNPILEAPFKRGEFSRKLSRKASSQPARILKLEMDFPLPKTKFKRPSWPAFYNLMVKETKRRRSQMADLKVATTFDELAATDSAWDEPILNHDDFEPEFEAYSK
ncbi:hypothetical protein L0F63_006873, partial [Massospora cicadina]